MKDRALAISRIETRKKNANQVDHLSNLPDELLITILSLLPTHIAAHTSILSRRFRHLWKASPSLEITDHCSNFVNMVNCIFFGRNPFRTLFNLHLNLIGYSDLERTGSFIASLLLKAHSHGLRHLTIKYLCSTNIEHILFVIFSIDTLQSLSLDSWPDPITFKQFDLFSGFTLTHLRSLSLRLSAPKLPMLEKLLSKLCSLEDLQLILSGVFGLRLSSETIKKLKLILFLASATIITLNFPFLEQFHLDSSASDFNLSDFHGEMPLLRKAVIILNELHLNHAYGIARLLTCISHVEELILEVKESEVEKYPIPVLLKAVKLVPEFSSLKILDVNCCCHKHNIAGIIALLSKSPALDSLKLVHEIPEAIDFLAIRRNKSDWESKLLHYSDAICHQNLHLSEKKSELMVYVPLRRRVKELGTTEST